MRTSRMLSEVTELVGDVLLFSATLAGLRKGLCVLLLKQAVTLFSCYWFQLPLLQDTFP